MRYVSLLLVLFSAYGRLPAQPAGDAVLSGRVVDADQRAVRNTRVVIVGVSETRTDDDGLFRVSIPAQLAEVQIELEQYDVVYPRGGRTPVPKSAATPVVIEVKKLDISGQEKLVRRLRETVQKLEADKRFKEAELDQMEKSLQDTIRSYQRLFDESHGRSTELLDSLQQTIQNLLAAQESTLLVQKKAQRYREITQSLLDFLDQAKNLRDALVRIDDVFLSEKARSDFEKQVLAYNAARDSLYNRHKSYIEDVRLFWKDNDATQKMEMIADLALVQIHEGIMLPMNAGVIAPVRDYATGQRPRLAAQKKARKGAAKALEQLAFPLRNLELKINDLTNLLTH